MSFINFLKKTFTGDNAEEPDFTPEIKEDLFVKKITEQNQSDINTSIGIMSIYEFLQSDFESRGYNDALVSPDEKYKLDNLRLIQYDLEIIISKVKTYHESMLKEIDFHINTRSRAGLVDLVEELKTKREDLITHIGKVDDIAQSVKGNSGLFERALLCYQRGFTKGLSSITQSSLLNRTF